jgi:hypothetical protein
MELESAPAPVASPLLLPALEAETSFVIVPETLCAALVATGMTSLLVKVAAGFPFAVAGGSGGAPSSAVGGRESCDCGSLSISDAIQPWDGRQKTLWSPLALYRDGSLLIIDNATSWICQV